MIRLHRLLVVVLLLASMSTLAVAEPTGSIKYLMTDSVSMLDWGLFLINNELAGKKIKNGEVRGKAEYIPDTDRIEISVGHSYFDEGELPTSDYQEMCRKIIIRLRAMFGVYDGHMWGQGKNLEMYFGHHGFNRQNHPKDFIEDLANKIDLRGWASTRLPGNVHVIESVGLDCEAPLIGKEVLFPSH